MSTLNMGKIQKPVNKKNNNILVTNIIFSCSIGSIATYDISINNNGNDTKQINKDMNLSRNIIIATDWQYLLAFFLFTALMEANSTMAKSQDATVPLTETSKTIATFADSFSTNTKTTFSQNPTTTQSLFAAEYSFASITKGSVKTFYGMPSSTASLALQPIPISLSSTIASTQTSSTPDALSKGISIDEMPEYSSPTTTSKALISSKSTENQDQLYIAAYQQNKRRPNFLLTTKNITVQLGNNAYLPCNIQRILNKPISWLRLRDGHILSVDQATFISDQRFQSIFQGQSANTWSLQIKYVQASDVGWYEYQVPTEPKMSAKIYLGVVVPHTELIGDRNRFVKSGSRVELHCIVRDTLEPPAYIIWFRGKTQIINDNEKGWYTEIDRTIFGNADSSSNTIGSLIIPSVRKQDSDTYTCEPSNSASVSVDLHVISGEYSASAIMSAADSYRLNKSIFTCHFPFLLLLQTMGKT